MIKTKVPITTNPVPKIIFQFNGSPKKIAESNKTNTKLDLSIGATSEAFPACKAWK